MKKKLLIQDSGIKILILGVDGMLGHKVHEQLSKNSYKVYSTSRNSKGKKNKYFFKNVNILKTGQILNIIKKVKPNYVINCTGIIKQKLQSKKKNTLFLVNTNFPIYLDKYSKKLNYNHIHFSTDCVFDGSKGNYTEKDKPNAKDEYGRSKQKSEDKINKNSFIIRTSIIGHEKNRSKKSLLNWFLSQKKYCYGFKNAYFSGVTTLELSKIIRNIIKNKQFVKGLYNLSSKKISKYQLLKMIKAKYKKKIKIHPNTSFKIDRSLSSFKFKNKFNIKIKSWKIQIDQMHEDYISNKKLNNYL